MAGFLALAPEKEPMDRVTNRLFAVAAKEIRRAQMVTETTASRPDALKSAKPAAAK